MMRVSRFIRSFSSSANPLSAPFSLGLSDEQRSIQGLARKFAVEVMAPKAAKYDLSMEYPMDVFKEAWELGLVNTHVPSEYGGVGMGTLDGVIIAEEVRCLIFVIWTSTFLPTNQITFHFFFFNS